MTTNEPQGYTADILAQPEALRDTFAALEAAPALTRLAEQLRAGKFQRLILTGMGSSYFCFYPLYYRLASAGLAPILIETAELVQYAPALLREGSLVLACSQSGSSVETLRLLDLAAGKVPILGISNTPASPLARRSSAALLTRAGSETTVSCKTYTAGLLALDWLGDLLLEGRPSGEFEALRGLPDLFAGYLAGWREHVRELQASLAGMEQLFYAGRGPSLTSALVAGLTTKESTHFPAEGMSCAAFRHGPLEMAGPGTRVMIFAGLPATRALNQRLAEDARGQGAGVLWVDGESGAGALHLPGASPRALPLLEILPAQMLTLALAELRGHIPGQFSYATKITSIE